jgi:cytochrome c5
MVLLVRPFSRRAALAVAWLLTLAAAAVRPSLAAENAPAAPSTVTGGGVTLHSVNVEFPDPGRMFPGDGKADAINNNCLACHSAGMVLTQPAMSRAEWQSEVEKMRGSYKAPVEEADVPAIVDYLVALKGRK